MKNKRVILRNTAAVTAMIYPYAVMCKELFQNLHFFAHRHNIESIYNFTINYWYYEFMKTDDQLMISILIVPAVMLFYFLLGGRFKALSLFLFLLPELVNMRMLWDWMMSV